jgi:prephenate dehydrogenase
MGAIDSFFAGSFLSEGLPGNARFDLAVICTPVQCIPQWCERLLPRTRGLVTDVGSTKAGICKQVRDLNVDATQFCGSHPMAGSEKDGVEHARAGLFDGKVAIVTPSQDTQPAAVQLAEELWRELGCSTMRLSPQQHDDAVASTSHLPHIVAAALASATDTELLSVAATGWADTTRVASGSPAMWRQIILENRGPIAAALKQFAGNLQQWTAAVEGGDEEQIQKLLEQGKTKRDALGN